MKKLSKKIKKRFSKKELLPFLITTLISGALVSFLHIMGSFDFLELKMYDFKFNVRDELYDIPRDRLGVSIVYSDDQSYELLTEKFSYPYPRGKVWAKAIENIASLGAKVIVLDYMFDAPDLNTTRSKNVRDNLLQGRYSSLEEKNRLEQEFFIDDNDKLLSQAIIKVKEDFDTDVILSGKIKYDPNSTKQYSILGPTQKINVPEGINFGLIDIVQDEDGFLRQYIAYQKLPNNDNYNYSLAVESVLKFYEEDSNSLIPYYDPENRKIKIGENIVIGTYGGKSTFLLNFYGPSSSALGASGTFENKPLSQILDDDEICFGKCIWDEDEEIYLPDDEQNEVDDDWVNIMKWTNNQVFENKIVILGTSLAEEQDVKSVPLMKTEAGSFLMPGVDIHANAIQQILDNSYINAPYNELKINSKNWKKHIFLIITLVLVTLIIVSPFSTFGSTIGTVFLLIFWFFFSVGQFVEQFLWVFSYFYKNPKIIMKTFENSSIIPTIFPMVSILIPYGLNLSYKLYTENKNKKFLKNTFGNYISSELVDQMYESQQVPELGGKEGYHTLIFSDVASFSSFSEAMTAPQLVELLNEYLTAMTQIILDNGGTVDKYIGDAIVAFYGAPVKVDNHENKAILTVVQMNKKLDELRLKWRSEGDKWPDLVKNMEHRVGVNTGYLVTGNMGSELQMNYTCMGDTVNLAARLESGSKQWGIDAQVAQSVYDKTKDNFVYRKLGGIRVKGKTEPVNVYELICKKGEEPKNLQNLIKKFDFAMELYLKQEWDNAIKAFEDSDKLEDMSGPRKTNPSRTYIKICKEFKSNPPGHNWDGIYTFKSK